MSKSIEKRLEELKAKKRETDDLIRDLEREKRKTDAEKKRKQRERTKIARAKLEGRLGVKMALVRDYLSSLKVTLNSASDEDARKVSVWEALCDHIPDLADLVAKYDELSEAISKG